MAKCTVEQRVDKVIEAVGKMPNMTKAKAEKILNRKELFRVIKAKTVAGTQMKLDRSEPKEEAPTNTETTETDAVEHVRQSVGSGKAKNHVAKEVAKASVATQAIADGEIRNDFKTSEEYNSTAKNIQEAFGNKANTGEYTRDDVVFISSNGNPRSKNRVKPMDIKGNLLGVYKNLAKAIAVKADFVADSEEHLTATNGYNVGELAIVGYLEVNGYKRVTVGEGKSAYGLWQHKDKISSNMSKVDKIIEANSKYQSLLFGKLTAVSGIRTKTQDARLGIWGAIFTDKGKASQPFGSILNGEITAINIREARKLANGINNDKDLVQVIRWAEDAKIKEINFNMRNANEEWKANLVTALKDIGKFDSSKITKEYILERLDDMSTSMVGDNMEQGNTVLHEVGHALSQEFINNSNNKNHTIIKRLNKLHELALDADQSGELGLTNNNWKLDLHEFVTEIMTNPRLALALNNVAGTTKSIPLGSEIINAVQKIIELTMQIAGIKLNQENVTYQSLETINEMINEQQKDMDSKMDEAKQKKNNETLQKSLKKMMEDCK